MGLQGLDSRTILQPYIKDGKVDYQKLQDDGWIPDVVANIEEKDPQQLSRDHELAFWLNSYNIIILKSVLEKLESNEDWEGVTSLWRKFKFFIWRRHLVGQQKMSLYTLENKIIRDKFEDPRIHFAINCASTSCPYLPAGLFDGDTLNDQLDQLTLEFINSQNGVILKGDTLYLSEIFDMYRDDFGTRTELLEFIRSYWKGPDIPQDVAIEYQDYDWSLNIQYSSGNRLENNQ